MGAAPKMKSAPKMMAAVKKQLPKPLESTQKPESQPPWKPPLEAPNPRRVEKLQPWRPPNTTAEVAPASASVRSAPPKPSQAPTPYLESDSEDDFPPGDL